MTRLSALNCMGLATIANTKVLKNLLGILLRVLLPRVLRAVRLVISRVTLCNRVTLPGGWTVR